MAAEKIDLRKQLDSYRYEHKLLQRIPCSRQENKEYAKTHKGRRRAPRGRTPLCI